MGESRHRAQEHPQLAHHGSQKLDHCRAQSLRKWGNPRSTFQGSQIDYENYSANLSELIQDRSVSGKHFEES